MKPPSHPQPGRAQQGKEVSEAMVPRGKPNQNLFLRFQGGEVKHDKFVQLTRDSIRIYLSQDAVTAASQALEERSHARLSARGMIACNLLSFEYVVRRHDHTFNQVRCRSYETPRRPRAELPHKYP